MSKFDFAYDESGVEVEAYDAISGQLYKCPVCMEKVLVRNKGYITKRNFEVESFFKTSRNKQHLEDCEKKQLEADAITHDELVEIEHPNVDMQVNIPKRPVRGRGSSKGPQPSRIDTVKCALKRRVESVIVDGFDYELMDFIAEYFLYFGNYTKTVKSKKHFYFLGNCLSNETDYDKITLSKHFDTPHIQVEKKKNLQERELFLGYIKTDVKFWDKFNLRNCGFTFTRLSKEDFLDLYNLIQEVFE